MLSLTICSSEQKKRARRARRSCRCRRARQGLVLQQAKKPVELRELSQTDRFFTRTSPTASILLRRFNPHRLGQRLGFVGLLPRERSVLARNSPEMAVSCGLLVDGPQEIEIFDDGAR